MANDQEGKKASRKKKEMESQVIDFFNREENIPYNFEHTILPWWNGGYAGCLVNGDELKKDMMIYFAV